MTRSGIIEILSGRGPSDSELYQEARAIRRQHLGDRLFVRGVIEITNVCRVNCLFCPMRRDNIRSNDTFTLSATAAMQAARDIHSCGITTVFLQGGELPATTDFVCSLLPGIRAMYSDGVEILLNLGNKPRHEYQRLRDAGATSYILKLETTDPALYEQIKDESLDSRVACLDTLVELGFHVGTGVIAGLPGQTVESLADDLIDGRERGVEMFSVSPFVPASHTPFERYVACPLRLALRSVAVARLLMPQALIPTVSALQLVHQNGQEEALNAGANVVTVNFTPEKERSDYLIYGKDRYIVKLEHARQLALSSAMSLAASPWSVPVALGPDRGGS